MALLDLVPFSRPGRALLLPYLAEAAGFAPRLETNRCRIIESEQHWREFAARWFPVAKRSTGAPWLKFFALRSECLGGAAKGGLQRAAMPPKPTDWRAARNEKPRRGAGALIGQRVAPNRMVNGKSARALPPRISPARGDARHGPPRRQRQKPRQSSRLPSSLRAPSTA